MLHYNKNNGVDVYCCIPTKYKYPVFDNIVYCLVFIIYSLCVVCVCSVCVCSVCVVCVCVCVCVLCDTLYNVCNAHVVSCACVYDCVCMHTLQLFLMVITINFLKGSSLENSHVHRSHCTMEICGISLNIEIVSGAFYTIVKCNGLYILID